MRQRATRIPAEGRRLLENILDHMLKLTGGMLATIQAWASEVLDNFCSDEVGARVAPLQELSGLLPMLCQDRHGNVVRYGRRYVVGTTAASNKGNIFVHCLGQPEPEKVPVQVARMKGIPEDHPILLEEEEQVKLEILIRLAEWAEEHGLISKGWSSNPDLHIETGLMHRPQKRSEGRSLADFVQYRHKGDMDTDRMKWSYVLEKSRTDRFLEVPLSSLIVHEGAKGRVVITDERVYGTERRETGRDPRDVGTEDVLGAFFDHEGYNGVVPRHVASRNDNAMLKRLRYRFNEQYMFLVQAGDGEYSRVVVPKPYVYDENGEVRENCTEEGQILPEHLELCGLRSVFKAGGSSVKYWNKRFMPPEMIQVVWPFTVTDSEEIERLKANPKTGIECLINDELKTLPVVELKRKPLKEYGRVVGEAWEARVPIVTEDKKVSAFLRDPNKRKGCKLAWKGGLYVPIREKNVKGELELNGEWRQSAPAGISTLTAEAFGMIRGVIETGMFSDVALFKSPDYDAKDDPKDWPEAGWRLVEGRTVPPKIDPNHVHATCRRCRSRATKWAEQGPYHESDGHPTVPYTMEEIESVLTASREPKLWTKRNHVWVCTHCGAERIRVTAHVYVPIEYLGMLPISERISDATHVEVLVYGEWVSDLVAAGLPVDGKPHKLPFVRNWTPPSIHPTNVEETELTVHPSWVNELLLPESKSSAAFWKAFKDNVIQRLVKDPAKRKKAEKAQAAYAERMARLEREYIKSVYDKESSTK